MKRERSDSENPLEGLDIAKCLMLLSQSLVTKPILTNSSVENDSFECKTCNRKFSSFQALGGHRASHKRPKLTNSENQTKLNVAKNNSSSKHVHECSICGQAFGTGQALGGHMRRHRVIVNGTLSSTLAKSPVLNRSGSCRRVLCLDLNLTPLENDLEYIFGKNMAPKIDQKFIV